MLAWLILKQLLLLYNFDAVLSPHCIVVSVEEVTLHHLACLIDRFELINISV